MGFLIVMFWMVTFLFLAIHFYALLECLFVTQRQKRHEEFEKMNFYKKIIYYPTVYPLLGLPLYLLFCWFIYKIFILSL